jgi:hypothetical protein
LPAFFLRVFMAFLFQVKVVPLDPKAKTSENKKAIKALSSLRAGAVICAEVYENSINGLENRLLVVTRAYDGKIGKITLAGIPDLYATRENYPKMPRLIERDITLTEIARFIAIKEGEQVKVYTKNGDEAVGRFHKANAESGYPGLARLEIVLIGGTRKKPLEEIIQISDVNQIEFLGRKPVIKEVFQPYEFR